MANIVKNFLGYLKLSDDDNYDDYSNDYDDTEREKLEKVEKRAASKSIYSNRDNDDEITSIPKRERTPRTERTSSNKIIPIRTTPKGLEVCIMKPTSFDDSKELCDVLLTGRACVVNLEGFDVDVAQRIMDFVSGAVYSLNGKLHQISSYIFIISPDNVDISGDYLDLIPDTGFEVPTLNKEF